eukprot:gene8130-biopygen69
MTPAPPPYICEVRPPLRNGRSSAARGRRVVGTCSFLRIRSPPGGARLPPAAPCAPGLGAFYKLRGGGEVGNGVPLQTTTFVALVRLFPLKLARNGLLSLQATAFFWYPKSTSTCTPHPLVVCKVRASQVRLAQRGDVAQ